MCSFYHKPLRASFKINVNKFAILDHMALRRGIEALGNYLKLNCEYKLHILLNTKVGTVKDHGKNYIKVRPLLVCYLLRNHLLTGILDWHIYLISLIKLSMSLTLWWSLLKI